MSDYREIKPEEINENPFKLIGADWMLVTAEKEGKVNTMTASWGGLGVIWGKNVAYVVIRPQRFTKEFVDASASFSLTFFDDSYKKELGYIGSVSGRDDNKIGKSKLTIAHADGTPYFSEANLVLICSKLYTQELKAENFVKQDLALEFYPDRDYHTLYVAEIQKVLVKG